MDFTVIFLTKGRTEIYKSLKSVLKITEYQINLKLIIIDGNDDNTVEHIINEKFSKYKNYVKIFKQKNKGFMNGCFQAINLVDTKFFTFMYDDDELSPYVGVIVKKCIEENRISFSFGKVEAFSNNLNFKEPIMATIDARKILSKYFSLNFKKKFVMPNSPICSVFRSSIMKEWKNILQSYSEKDDFFNFYLMKKNIGPDLLLYLISLIHEKKEVIYSETYVAKFSSHVNSMSITYGNVYLGVGYLYARCIFLDFFKQNLVKENLFHPFKNYVCIKIFYFIFRGNFYLNKIKNKTLNHLYMQLKKYV